MHHTVDCGISGYSGNKGSLVSKCDTTGGASVQVSRSRYLIKEIVR